MFLELNIKTQENLTKYLEVLKSQDYSEVSITSKKNNLDLVTVLNTLQNNKLKIIPTFSCSSNYNQNANQTYKEFLSFVKILKQNKINQLLLVSGNPKMKLETLKVLEQFGNESDDQSEYQSIKIAVAYNLYCKNMDIENQRLKAKLVYPNVNQVWLQLGQDLEKLKTGVDFIRKINPNIVIINSVLMPTQSLLKSLQFRPWAGVYYCDQFYNDINFALKSTGEMKRLSKQLGLKILISGV